MTSLKKKFNALIAAGLMVAMFTAGANDLNSYPAANSAPLGGDPGTIPADLLKSPSPSPLDTTPDRTIRIGDIDQKSVQAAINKLRELDRKETAPITLIVNSGGGTVKDGLALIDVMRSLNSPVNTVCEGWAMSMGAYILTAGTGTRSSYEHCNIMFHSLSGAVQGTMSDMEIDIAETRRMNDDLIDVLTQSTGLFKSAVRQAVKRDFNLTAEEARSINVIDRIIPPKHKRVVKEGSQKLPTLLENRVWNR